MGKPLKGNHHVVVSWQDGQDSGGPGGVRGDKAADDGVAATLVTPVAPPPPHLPSVPTDPAADPVDPSTPSLLLECVPHAVDAFLEAVGALGTGAVAVEARGAAGTLFLSQRP